MSTMSLPRLEVTMQPTDPAAAFCAYVASGDHWRHGERRTAVLRGQGHDYAGPMHSVSRDGGAVASVQLHPRFVEHMDAEPWSEQAERRWVITEDAVRKLYRELDDTRDMELAAWRYFVVPEHFRKRSTLQQANTLEVDTTTLYRARDRVTAWAWELIVVQGFAGHWASRAS